MEITPQEKELIFIFREIKDWGFGEINIKFADNEITTIKASKNYKPVDKVCDNIRIVHIQATEVIA